MHSQRLVIACSIFLIGLLFTPGCIANPAWAEHVPTPDASALSARDATTDAEMRDRPRPNPLTCGELPAIDLRTNLCAADAGSDRPAAPDVSTPPDVALRHTEPYAVILPPTTCHGRRLPMSTAALARANEGMTLWHLCYKTPSPAHSDHPIARLRANQVNLNLVTLNGTRELLHVPAPMVANPWTASVLVALPATHAPLFELLNQYQAGQRLSAVSTDRMGRFPFLHGELQVWKVTAEGTQTEQPPAQACYEPHSGTVDPAFFLPTNSCTREADCPLLSQFVCRPF